MKLDITKLVEEKVLECSRCGITMIQVGDAIYESLREIAHNHATIHDFHRLCSGHPTRFFGVEVQYRGGGDLPALDFRAFKEEKW